MTNIPHPGINVSAASRVARRQEAGAYDSRIVKVIKMIGQIVGGIIDKDRAFAQRNIGPETPPDATPFGIEDYYDKANRPRGN